MRLQLAELEAAKMQQDIKNKEADEVNTKTQSMLNLSKIEHEHALAAHEAILARDDAIEAKRNANREHNRKDLEVGVKLIKELKDEPRPSR